MYPALSKALATAILTAAPLTATNPQQAGVKRTDLQRHDLSIGNRETVQARIDIAGVRPRNGTDTLAKR